MKKYIDIRKISYVFLSLDIDRKNSRNSPKIKFLKPNPELVVLASFNERPTFTWFRHRFKVAKINAKIGEFFRQFYLKCKYPAKKLH